MFHEHEEIYLFCTARSSSSVIQDVKPLKNRMKIRKHDEEIRESLLRKLLFPASKGMLYL
ncbi:hypothetical protein BU200_06635 [Streptococcus acidominimus]|uniref:Uncharacterized protein n=1 Tax=Streptococcus acidominimus TaxID=1326 RepID=A0A1Q8ECP4_STRAI|nr:hypothetical protein BU200_06635 [Streptococcus acidominimus]